MTIVSLEDLQELGERVDFEAKKAGGVDGQGECPKSFFESYSAMANTDGGAILLGAEEREGKLRIAGIADVPRVLKALWDSLNNRQRVSINLLTDHDVEVREVDGKRVILVRVPRARRNQRPVHVGENPFKGTYVRNGEGDYLIRDDEAVRRMLAERVEDSRDGRILPHYSLEDIDAETLARYRNHFKAKKPDHIWNGLDDREFLRSIGGWRRDREAGTGGLTAAGLLMFGRHTSIAEEFPYYMVDYQERPEAKADGRWVDRLVPDGTWSGNLFDFYERVIQRLFRDLKVPFRLSGDRRVDETPVHEALREALVNAIIHADYSGRVSVLIAKRPDMFGFRNPGGLRIPVDLAVKGGSSDCRNRSLQAMFRHAGLGEQAGSGVPKIYSAWRDQQWRAPEIEERTTPTEQTVVQLRMMSLLPTEAIASLQQRFGTSFRQLSDVHRLALVTVELEGHVTHERLMGMTDRHSRDVTLALASLLHKGMLESAGGHRQKRYFFPGQPPSAAEDEFMGFAASTEDVPGSSELKPGSSEHRDASSEHRPAGSEHKTHPDDPSPSEWEKLEAQAAPLRRRKRASPEDVSNAIVGLCTGRPLTLPQLSRLLGRTVDTLRVHYLTKLVAAGRLRLRHPEAPTHPNQGYVSEPGTPPQ
jgi:ATP-dependent DNA helicase RecG